jgi:hypothetical protein
MQLTYRGVSYNSEAPTVTHSYPAPFVGKYRGVEFIAIRTTMPVATTHQHRYRGISY